MTMMTMSPVRSTHSDDVDTEEEDLSFSGTSLKRFLHSHLSQHHLQLRDRVYSLKRHQRELWEKKCALVDMDEHRRLTRERAVSLIGQGWVDVETQIRDPDAMFSLYEATSVLDACCMGKIAIQFGSSKSIICVSVVMRCDQ